MPKVGQETIDKLLKSLTFDRDGLIPAIAQQHDSGEVLMMAWMNRDAVVSTLSEGKVCYWSRSRQALWRKGETSGQTQHLLDFRWDCDSDTILLQVDQVGVACHTGRRNCFFNAVVDDEIKTIADVSIDPKSLYGGD
jgi:phosphoribosyl-AMP cyclohydrolase